MKLVSSCRKRDGTYLLPRFYMQWNNLHIVGEQISIAEEVASIFAVGVKDVDNVNFPICIPLEGVYLLCHSSRGRKSRKNFDQLITLRTPQLRRFPWFIQKELKIELWWLHNLPMLDLFHSILSQISVSSNGQNVLFNSTSHWSQEGKVPIFNFLGTTAENHRQWQWWPTTRR